MSEIQTHEQPLGARAGPAPRAGRAAVAAAISTSLEWYDFFIYSTAAALVFNVTFFATGNEVVSAVNSFATVAVGFIARPIGGILAGHFGDKIGRKPVLVTAVVLMAVATSLIGFVPNTEIVWLAPMLLITLRICQGLAVGAQWGGAVLLATENAPANRRGFFGSFAQLGVPIGVVLGNVVFLILTATVAQDSFLSWGWRIPFWISLIMLPVAFAIHRYLEETPEFKKIAAKLEGAPAARRSPIVEVLRKNPGTVLMAAGSNAIGVIFFYTMITGSVQYATTYLGLGRSTVLTFILIACLLQIPLVPLFGHLSDRIGRKLVFGAGTVAMMVWGLPMWLLIGASGAGQGVAVRGCGDRRRRRDVAPDGNTGNVVLGAVPARGALLRSITRLPDLGDHRRLRSDGHGVAHRWRGRQCVEGGRIPRPLRRDRTAVPDRNRAEVFPAARVRGRSLTRHDQE